MTVRIWKACSRGAPKFPFMKLFVLRLLHQLAINILVVCEAFESVYIPTASASEMCCENTDRLRVSVKIFIPVSLIVIFALQEIGKIFRKCHFGII